MSIPEIPQDIIDLISQTVAEIALSDPKPLKVLSLVSQAFLLQSQRYLFHTIRLLPQRQIPHTSITSRPLSRPGIDIRGKKLNGLLSTSPHVLTYVRTLALHPETGAELAWVVKISEAAAIIHACTQLQIMELVFPPGIMMTPIVKWSGKHSSMQSVLISQVRSTRLCELTLVNIKQIPRVYFTAFGLLRVLRLYGVSPSSPESQLKEYPAETTPSQANSCLTTLSITELNEFLQLLLAEEILLSRVPVLDVGHTTGGVPPMRDLLLSVRGVEELHITLLPNGKSNCPHIWSSNVC